MNSASIMKPRSGGSRRVFANSEDSFDPGNSAALYGRVAMVEAVLSIRNRQQRVTRRVVVAGLVVTGVAFILAGLSGWF